jgi:phage tail-like protein
MATSRPTPYSAFNFLVQVGNTNEADPIAGFSEVSGLNTEMTVAEYRAGNYPENHTRKMPGVYKTGDITLKRGLIGETNLWAWVDQMRTGGGVPAKRTVLITLQDEAHQSVASWQLTNAMPLKWTGPTLSAKGGGDVAMEELVLSVEKIDYL